MLKTLYALSSKPPAISKPLQAEGHNTLVECPSAVPHTTIRRLPIL